MKSLRFSVWIALQLSAFCALSQTYFTGKGTVIDSLTRHPISYATVAVFRLADNKLVDGAISDSSGNFDINAVATGDYRITIECLGYEKLTVDSVRFEKSALKKGAIHFFLRPSGKLLRETTITGEAPIIENKIDKLVYNTANDITSQGSMAIDVLKKVPQVNVDINGNVELLGNSNIAFLINGKPSALFGSSISDALAAIPASQIKSIEVVTSPGAKYDAQGTGGIINFVLKESKMQGLNCIINLNAGSRLESGNFNMNIRKNNFGINLFFNGNAQVSSRTPTQQTRSSYDSATGATRQLQQNAYSDIQRFGYTSGISADWNITKKDNVTAALTLNHFETTTSGQTNTSSDSGGGVQIQTNRNSANVFKSIDVDGSVGYRKTFEKEDKELSVQYNGTYSLPNNYFNQQTYYQGSVQPYFGSRSNNPCTVFQHMFSIDFATPLTEKILFETGAKTIFRTIAGNIDVDNYDPVFDSYYPSLRQSYNFSYVSNVFAGYVSASMPISERLKLKTGLRYEYTHAQFEGVPATIPSYGFWAPSVTLTETIKKGQFIKLSYSRRIERAEYWDMNPFLNYSDPNNLSVGNPLLLPEIGNNFELGYNISLNKKANLYIACIERINTQDHKNVTLYYATYATSDTVFNNVSVNFPQNVGTEYNAGINVSGSVNIQDKLNLRTNIFYMYRYSDLNMPGITGKTGIRFRMNLNVSYQFQRNLVGEVFGNYNAQTQNIQGITPQWVSYTIAFRKQFWNKNASIGITATNIFNEYTEQITTVTSANYTSRFVRETPYRSVGICMTYKFGKLEFKKENEGENFLKNQPAF
jgi:ferric enterobactin receptor